MLAVTKSNVADTPPALGYRIAAGPGGWPVVEWAGPAGVTADAVGGRPPAGLKPRDRATLWLHERMNAGPQRATEVLAAAAAAGIPEITLKRAKEALGLRSCRATRDGRAEWYWYDPTAPWPADSASE